MKFLETLKTSDPLAVLFVGFLSLIGVLIVGYFGFVGPRQNLERIIEATQTAEAKVEPQATSVDIVETFPLQLLERYDFEDINSLTNTEPWDIVFNIPGDIGIDKFLINTDSSTARESQQSLQIKSELRNLESGDWLSIYTDELPQEEISLASAWVYIPQNEQTEGRKFQGKIDLIGVVISGSSGPITIEPGKWTQLMVEGLPKEIFINPEEKGTPIPQDNPTSLAITIAHNATNAYTGSVYIDDIELYGTR